MEWISAMKVYNLQVNHLSRPIGISPEGLRVTWNIEGCLRQSAYEIRLLSSPSGSVCWVPENMKGLSQSDVPKHERTVII